MKTGDYVEIKEAKGRANWVWCGRKGRVVEVDNYCLTVRADDGETVRDVKEHFRIPPVMQ